MESNDEKKQALQAVAVPPEEEMDFSPFFDYLKTPQGHEVATRVLQIIEDVKKATIDKSHAHAKFERWLQAGVIMLVVVALVILSVFDKLNPTVAVALGSIVGYFFGKGK
jgi:hypothetical protein